MGAASSRRDPNCSSAVLASLQEEALREHLTIQADSAPTHHAFLVGTCRHTQCSISRHATATAHTHTQLRMSTQAHIIHSCPAPTCATLPATAPQAVLSRLTSSQAAALLSPAASDGWSVLQAAVGANGQRGNIVMVQLVGFLAASLFFICQVTVSSPTLTVCLPHVLFV